ncbi:MAG TPA: hypothetical protein VNV42_10425 [Solirubrobacteraceae bacterium]|jgi:hypothetical protein|nr:hypothetical protein [Solirubrobacteraceae bacterium]
MAWLSLPLAHRSLLEVVGASQWRAVAKPLGASVNSFLRSSGHPGLSRSGRASLDGAFGVWIEELRIVLINVAHPALAGLDAATYEAVVACVAWHEWRHALSLARCSSEDVAAGPRLLALAPEGVRETIRRAGYRRWEYTHELIAETYALLMARHRRNAFGRPSWLNNEIYNLMQRVTGWGD